MIDKDNLTQFVDMPEDVISGITKRERYLMRAMRQAVRADTATLCDNTNVKYSAENVAKYIDSAIHSANAWLTMAEEEK